MFNTTQVCPWRSVEPRCGVEGAFGLFCAGGVPSVFWSSHPSSAQLVLCSFIHASSWLVCVTRARMSIFVMFRLCELIVFLSDLGRNTHRVH